MKREETRPATPASEYPPANGNKTRLATHKWVPAAAKRDETRRASPAAKRAVAQFPLSTLHSPLSTLFQLLLLSLLPTPFSLLASAATAADAEHVIQISVDGLGPVYLERMVASGDAPTFKRLETEGAWTHNARADFDHTITLPNHTSMVTGRPVLDKLIGGLPRPGHIWLENGEPSESTLHANRHAYIQSTFDVAHDHGLRTGLFATKSKFTVYSNSYNAENGAPDLIPPDTGRNKVDVAVVTDKDSPAMLGALLKMIDEQPPGYAFVHFHNTDTAGHAKGWGTDEYNKAIHTVDGYLAEIIAALEKKKIADKTVLILSADHGGRNRNHADKTDPLDYTIPFYVWGAGVAHGADLYQLNPTTRKDPGTSRPDFSDEGPPPIHNADGGNLALGLLGLPAIAESSVNAGEDLRVAGGR